MKVILLIFYGLTEQDELQMDKLLLVQKFVAELSNNFPLWGAAN
jgi:hypothetical protein